MQGLCWHHQSRHMRVPGRRSSLLAWPAGAGKGAQRAASGQATRRCPAGPVQAPGGPSPPPARFLWFRPISEAAAPLPAWRLVPRPGRPPRPSGSRWVEGEPYAAVQACSTYADRRWRRAPSMRERMTPRCRHELLTVRLSYWRPLPGHHMPLFHTESASSGIQGTLLDRHIRARQCLASGNDIK